MGKMQKQSTAQHRDSNDRPRTITADENIVIEQWIERNNEFTANEIVEKLQLNRGRPVST
jgi:transposase